MSNAPAPDEDGAAEDEVGEHVPVAEDPGTSTTDAWFQLAVEAAIGMLQCIEEPALHEDSRSYHEVVAERLNTVIYSLQQTRDRLLNGPFRGWEECVD